MLRLWRGAPLEAPPVVLALAEPGRPVWSAAMLAARPRPPTPSSAPQAPALWLLLLCLPAAPAPAGASAATPLCCGQASGAKVDEQARAMPSWSPATGDSGGPTILDQH